MAYVTATPINLKNEPLVEHAVTRELSKAHEPHLIGRAVLRCVENAVNNGEKIEDVKVQVKIH
jgi:hypothetical protein